MKVQLNALKHASMCWPMTAQLNCRAVGPSLIPLLRVVANECGPGKVIVLMTPDSSHQSLDDVKRVYHIHAGMMR